MGFLDESYHTLLSPLRVASKDKQKGLVSNSTFLDKDFDLADSMEKGLARELVADFMEPLPDASNLWKFNVVRSDDRQQYRLYCEGGEFLLYAKASRDTRRVDLFLYDPAQKDCALFDAERPAFTMTCNPARTEWRLVQERCDHCRYATSHQTCPCRSHQEILLVRHTSVTIGSGVNHSMDVIIPANGYFGQTQEQRFVTKLPVWNEKVGCLVLDFQGRKILASAKNFQLSGEDDDSERVVCQYGKLNTNTFGLDFRHPLTVIQAFGISLTTLLWA